MPQRPTNTSLLPTKIRIVAVAALATGLIVSWQAAQELGLTLSASTIGQPSIDISKWPLSAQDAKQMKQALEASWFAQLHAIESMRNSRLPILIGLSLCASLVFVSALRIRWPFGSPRMRAIVILQRATVGVLIFRTLDAAQSVVIARSGAQAMLKWMPSPVESLPTLVSIASGLQTLFVLGLFFLFSQYLGSANVVNQVQTIDASRADDE